MNIKVCDICRRSADASGSENPADLESVTVTVARTAPGEPGKKGKSVPVSRIKGLELCCECMAGLASEIGILIAELRDGSAALPESDPVGAVTVDLTAPADDVPSLPMPVEEEPASKKKQKRETAMG